jgi:hypothetical protein
MRSKAWLAARVALRLARGCSGEALTSPAYHACGFASPFRACVWSIREIALTGSPRPRSSLGGCESLVHARCHRNCQKQLFYAPFCVAENREDQLNTTVSSFAKMQERHAEKESSWLTERQTLSAALADANMERERLKESDLHAQARLRELGNDLVRAQHELAAKQAQLDAASTVATESRAEVIRYVHDFPI